MNSFSTIPNLFLKKINKSVMKKAIGYIENNELQFLSNDDYKNIVKKISFAFKEIINEKENRISILAHTSKEWHFFDLGILISGNTTVPVYPTYLAHEVEYILNHLEAKIIIIDSEQQLSKLIEIQKNLKYLTHIISTNFINEKVVEHIGPNLTYYTLDSFYEIGANAILEKKFHFEDMITSVAENDIASIIYTSGTTGEPKGAVVTQKAFCKMLHNVHDSLKNNLSPIDRNLVFLPLSHVLGRCDSLLNLAFDNETVYAESLEKVVDNLKIAKPTFLIAVPRIFEKVYSKVLEKMSKESEIKQKLFDWAIDASREYFQKIEADKAPTSIEIIQKNLAYNLVFKNVYELFGGRVRFLVSGGAPLSPDIIRFLQYANLTILEGYGLTETIAPCVLNPPVRQIPGTIGIPLGDVQIQFGEDGEILIKTEALFSGYLKNEEASKNAFNEAGWFLTGDIGELTPEGFIKITDRKKDIIITSAGKNIAPQKIENLLKLKKHISQAMVVGDQRKFLTAIVSIDLESIKSDPSLSDIDKSVGYEAMASDKSIYQLIESEIAEVNEELASFESIKGFIIASSDFTIENGQITPSLKLKKKIILKTYKDEVDALYKKLEA